MWWKTKFPIIWNKQTWNISILTGDINNTKIGYIFAEHPVYEAHSIIDKQPPLNRQVDNFINPLKLLAGSNHDHRTFVAVQTGNDVGVDCDMNVNSAPCRCFLRSGRGNFIMCIPVYMCHDFLKASDLKVEMENWCRRRSRVYFKHRHPVTISRKAKSCSRREKELVAK